MGISKCGGGSSSRGVGWGQEQFAEVASSRMGRERGGSSTNLGHGMWSLDT